MDCKTSSNAMMLMLVALSFRLIFGAWHEATAVAELAAGEVVNSKFRKFGKEHSQGRTSRALPLE